MDIFKYMANYDIKAIFSIIRPANCLIASFATLIGFFLSKGQIIFPQELIIGFFLVFFICGAGQAINDYYDYENDKKTNKKKIIPSGKLTQTFVKKYSVFLFSLGIILSFFTNSISIIIAIIFALLLYFYSAKFKTKKYFGNIIVALGTAFTFIFGASLYEINLLVILIAVSAFFANMAREIIKDIEDIKTDKNYKVSLPMKIGIEKSKIVIGIYLILAVIFALSTGYLYNLNYYYFTLISIVGFGFALTIKYVQKNNLTKAQKIAKIFMFLSFIAYASILII